MRRFFIMSLLLGASHTIYGQYHITYKYSYFNKADEQQKAIEVNDKLYQDYYITDGFYSSVFDGGSTWMWI